MSKSKLFFNLAAEAKALAEAGATDDEIRETMKERFGVDLVITGCEAVPDIKQTTRADLLEHFNGASRSPEPPKGE